MFKYTNIKRKSGTNNYNLFLILAELLKTVIFIKSTSLNE
jgi:hypothetical protein